VVRRTKRTSSLREACCNRLGQALTGAELTCILMLTGVSSDAVMTARSLGRYTHLLMDASPKFPIHFLKIYSEISYSTMCCQRLGDHTRGPRLLTQRQPTGTTGAWGGVTSHGRAHRTRTVGRPFTPVGVFSLWRYASLEARTSLFERRSDLGVTLSSPLAEHDPPLYHRVAYRARDWRLLLGPCEGVQPLTDHVCAVSP
jgi:hypothetical protein